MSYALQYFLESSRSISTIIHRYCEPGHSSIQDVDALHSVISNHFKHIDVHSPVSLVNHLEQLKCGGEQLNVHVMSEAEFLDYSSTGKYSKIPYTKVKELRYSTTDINNVHYKLSFSAEYISVEVFSVKRLRNGQ